MKHSPKGQPNPTDANDTINGGGKNDKVKSFGGNDAILGGKGNDKMSGLEGDDTILGGKGNDRASGGNGSDLISGGTGTNKLIGGSGADSFRFDSDLSKSFNKVMDFDSAEGDKVLLAKSIFDDKDLKDGNISADDFNKHFDYTKHRRAEIRRRNDRQVQRRSGTPFRRLHVDLTSPESPSAATTAVVCEPDD